MSPMTIRTFLFFSSSRYCKEREWKSTAHLILITANPLKMATPVSQPLVTVGHTFTETTNSYDIILGHYSNNFATHISWILATESHLVVCFMCKFNLPMLADIKGCIVFVSYCKWARILIQQQNNLLPNQPPSFSASMGNRFEFLGGNWLMNVLEDPVYWQGYEPAFQLDHVSLHSELYIWITDCYTVQFSECHMISTSWPPVQVRQT